MSSGPRRGSPSSCTCCCDSARCGPLGSRLRSPGCQRCRRRRAVDASRDAAGGDDGGGDADAGLKVHGTRSARARSRCPRSRDVVEVVESAAGGEEAAAMCPRRAAERPSLRLIPLSREKERDVVKWFF